MALIIRWKLSLLSSESAVTWCSFVMIMWLLSPQFCAWNMMLGDEILQCCSLMPPSIFHPVVSSLSLVSAVAWLFPSSGRRPAPLHPNKSRRRTNHYFLLETWLPYFSWSQHNEFGTEQFFCWTKAQFPSVEWIMFAATHTLHCQEIRGNSQ